MSWQERAACRAAGPDVMFPQRLVDVPKALTYCASCPVADDCYQEAVDRGEKHGVWGGRVWDEWRNDRPPRTQPQRPDVPCESCGTPLTPASRGPLPRYCPACLPSAPVNRPRKPRRRKPSPQHGTVHAYTNGCRCDLCRAAQRRYMNDYRTRQRQGA